MKKIEGQTNAAFSSLLEKIIFGTLIASVLSVLSLEFLSIFHAVNRVTITVFWGLVLTGVWFNLYRQNRRSAEKPFPSLWQCLKRSFLDCSKTEKLILVFFTAC